MPKTGRKKIEDKIYMTNLQKRFGAKRKKEKKKKKALMEDKGNFSISGIKT